MKPEMLVRRLVHRLGYRFRLHRKDLPGKPDLVFPSRRKVIFVHGCFWHQHPDLACRDARPPRSNSVYWEPKLTRNVQRDQKAKALLERDRWSVLVLWECELRDKDRLISIIVDFLDTCPAEHLGALESRRVDG